MISSPLIRVILSSQGLPAFSCFVKVEMKLQRYLERQAMGAAASAEGEAAAAAAGGWGSGFWARLAAKVLDNVQVRHQSNRKVK